MSIFLYHFMWTLALVFCFPIVLLTRRKRLFERLALRLPSSPLEAGNIWVHALSVGEVISAIPLVEALNRVYPHKDIVFTAATSKGMAIARDRLEGKVRALLVMPVDCWWSIRRMVNHIRPSVFILVETDIWPGITDHLKKKGVKSILVNGRVSPRTFRYYRRFSPFTRLIFKGLEWSLMQSDLDRVRLIQAGINPERVRTVGNIKFDQEWTPMEEEERQELINIMGLRAEDLIWVAGSTHPGEEEILLKVFSQLRPSFKSLLLILAPRNIERSDNICRQAQEAGFRVSLKTVLPGNGEPYEIIILDTLGELARIYGLAKVSFVGGSLVPFGGHNLLEPASFGCPVLFGPYTDNFFEMSEALVEAGGGKRIQDSMSLFEAMKMIMEDSHMTAEMGRHAKVFVESNRGALERIIKALRVYIV